MIECDEDSVWKSGNVRQAVVINKNDELKKILDECYKDYKPENLVQIHKKLKTDVNFFRDFKVA